MPLHWGLRLTLAVCIKVLETIDSELQGGDKKKTGKIEAAIDKYCSRKDLHQREKKIVSPFNRPFLAAYLFASSEGAVFYCGQPSRCATCTLSLGWRLVSDCGRSSLVVLVPSATSLNRSRGRSRSLSPQACPKPRFATSSRRRVRRSVALSTVSISHRYFDILSEMFA